MENASSRTTSLRRKMTPQEKDAVLSAHYATLRARLEQAKNTGKPLRVNMNNRVPNGDKGDAFMNTIESILSEFRGHFVIASDPQGQLNQVDHLQAGFSEREAQNVSIAPTARDGETQAPILNMLDPDDVIEITTLAQRDAEKNAALPSRDQILTRFPRWIGPDGLFAIESQDRIADQILLIYKQAFTAEKHRLLDELSATNQQPPPPTATKGRRSFMRRAAGAVASLLPFLPWGR